MLFQRFLCKFKGD